MASVLVCTPPSGSLRQVQWNSNSIRKLCEDVLHAQATKTRELGDRFPSSSEPENLSSSVELHLVPFEKTTRSLSPGLAESALRGIYFVRPAWDDIAEIDADYEKTLLARRHKGDVLYMLRPDHSTLRSGCEFIVTDPKWLLSRFFVRTNSDSIILRDTDLPWFVRNKKDARRFWAGLRNIDEEDVNDFECQCVFELLKHVGAAHSTQRIDPVPVCFPVMAYRHAPKLESSGHAKRDHDLIARRVYATRDERDAFAFMLTQQLCSLDSPGMEYTFFSQHLLVKVGRQGSILIQMFDDAAVGSYALSLWRNWNFPVPQSLLSRLLAQLEGMPVIGSTAALFRKTRMDVCDCGPDRGECALCIFADVTRSLFLGEYASEGLHTDVELVQRSVDNAIYSPLPKIE